MGKLKPTVIHETYLNANGSEYWGTFKIAIPVQMTPENGNVTIHATSTANQYNIYFANNTDYTEQSYVIADPLYTSVNAQTIMKWSTEKSIFGTIIVHKIDDMGLPLEGAIFHLEGSDGSIHTGTSDASGLVKWETLNPALKYVVREIQAPPGYRISDPVNVSVLANETVNLTIKNESDRYFRLRKVDAQNGYPLGQAVFRFEQIDGNYSTDAVTGHDGYIEFKGGELPFGSYKVYEVQAPSGYEIDTSAQTVNWNGRQDVMLTFKNVRTLSLVLIKSDFDTKATLENAVFKLYKDGNFITTATTNSAGEIRFSNLEPGYYEVEEQQAPTGYILDNRRHGINIDPYNTATTADPLLVVTNKAKGTLKIRKIDSTDSAKGLDGVVLRVQNATMGIDRQYTTANGGYITVSGLEPADYIITEIATIPGYELSDETVVVTVKYGETANAIFKNEPKGKITLIKVDSVTGKHLPGANIKLTNPATGQTWDLTTGADGTVNVDDLAAGEYYAQEQNPPKGYELNNQIFPVTVVNGEYSSVKIQNNPLGTMLITKIDIKTGLPMAGVKLRICNDSLNYDKTETTDSKGQIHLIDLKPGDYTISEVATIPGYELSKEVLTKAVAYGQETTVTFTNSPKGSVRVIKVDSVTGKHLPGANIKFTSLATQQTWDLTTGADGTATVTDLIAGHYTFQEQNAPPHYELNNQVFNVTVVNGELSSVKIQNNPLGTMLITKVDVKTGLPMAGVKLRIYNDTLNYDKTETTDSKGQVHLIDLLPGDYTITEVATIPGYELSTEVLTRTVDYGKETTVTFKNLQLGSATVVKVDSLTGAHLANANIKLTNPATGQTWDLTTGADGTATVTDLTAGEYYFQEQNPPKGYELNNQTFPVTVVNGENSSVKIQNNPLGTMLITKIDVKTGLPMAGVRIRIYNDTLNFDRTETTDSKGQIHLIDLYPADYTITEVATIPGYELSTEVLTRTVSYGLETTVVFKNLQLGSATVVKVDSLTGEHLANANIKLTNPATGQTWDLITSADGTATVTDLTTGEYYFQEQNPPQGYELNNQTFPVTVVNGENSSVKIQNNPLGSLLITKVSSKDGTIVLEGVKLRIYNDELNFDRTETTDSKGRIRLTGLFPGDYAISEIATISGYELSDEILIKTVDYGKETTAVFKNQPLGSATVIKVDSITGEHLANANIKLTNPTTGQTWDLTTGADGTATVTDLAAGEYYFQEQNPPKGYELNNQTFPVTVVNGENSSVKIQDNPLGKIEITKVDSLDATKTLAGVKMRVQNTLLGYDKTFTTDENGKILIEDLYPADYTISEVATILGYVLSDETIVATVNYGKTTPVTFKNEPKPYIEILKIDSQSNMPIPKTSFRVTNRNTQQNYNVTTDADGRIIIENVDVGWYDIVEITPPTHYVPDYTVYSVYADIGKPGKITIKNTKMPSLTVLKVDKDTQKPLGGGIFSIEKIGEPNNGIITGSPFTTDNSGKIYIPELIPGSYKITEIQPPFGYNLSENNSQIITMVAGQDNTVKFENTRQPSFILTKTDSKTGKAIEGAAFKLEKLDNPGKGAVTGTPLYTDENGQIIIPNLLSGMYRVTEVEPANGYGMPSPNVWEINIIANEDYNLKVKNTRLPSLIINKIDGWSYKGIPNTYFEVTYAVNGSFYGETINLGTYKTDKNGQIVIPNCQPGLYRYTEVRPAPGYSKPSNPTKDVFLKLGDNAYSGVGGSAWLEENGQMVMQTAPTNAVSTPTTQKTEEQPTQASPVPPTPTSTPEPAAPTATEPPKQEDATPTQEPSTPSGSGLTPSKPNNELVPTKPNNN